MSETFLHLRVIVFYKNIEGYHSSDFFRAPKRLPFLRLSQPRRFGEVEVKFEVGTVKSFIMRTVPRFRATLPLP